MEDGGWDSLSTHPGLLWLNVVLLATVTLAWATLFCGHGGPCSACILARLPLGSCWLPGRLGNTARDVGS